MQIERRPFGLGGLGPCRPNGAWRPVSVLDEWVAREARPISLRQLMVFGRSLTESRLISSANYVRTELPVRIAHRLRDMQRLPYVVVTNQHINDVYDLYYNAFDTFRRLKEVKTLEDNDKLCSIISQNLKGHLTVIPKLAQGILECGELMDPRELDQFMNTILRSRISRRVIAEQHLSLTETYNSPYFSPGAKLSESDFIGEVFIKCSAKDVVDRCAKAVRALARSTNGPDVAIPEIRVVGHLDASFPYILSHIEYIVGELLRNSVQAVADRQQHKKPDNTASSLSPATTTPPPPVEVTVCEAQEHVIFRISDQGGGIPRDQLPHLWSFSKGPQSQRRLENLGQVPRMAATMQELHVQDELARADLKTPPYQSSLSPLTVRPPNLRLGMGLPLSRVYAEYWAGSLHLHSLEGYGVDAFLQISRLGNKNEQLTTRASMDAV
ncbi:mitochondrial branched-chain alpha-ketoacid dehydrogenase kinase [Hirsutella rhossiliensis]|uniref:Protein-serine/threonine kinase n=1 Tax=Hirsutella rhossiliensis TaxID=111463 RepID=A0A9P8N5E1_9HYPO|nr:mitochondrial branched-chain alpha-ketoacid dehydrogenase kinase [Hirsutella rhossiliensis]KAH0964962.1 mitochondrial branched-chain alpha-ketoacid dehydrogenase kinase [Hirsutella rhossiliensis]